MAITSVIEAEDIIAFIVSYFICATNGLVHNGLIMLSKWQVTLYEVCWIFLSLVEFRMTSNFTNVKQQSQLSKTQVETLAKQAGLRRGNSEFEEGYYFEKTTQQSARKDHGALVDGKAASVPEGMAESEEGEEHIYNEIESNHIEDFGLEKTSVVF